MKSTSLSFLLFVMLLSFLSCGSDEMEMSDDYNRSSLLDTWANQLIIPSYENYLVELRALASSTTEFVNDQDDPANLVVLKDQFFATRMAWQNVDMFEIGPAQAVNLRLRSNTFPVDIEGVKDHIEAGVYDLELPSSISKQGFPTIEYILFSNELDLSEISVTNYLLDITETLLNFSEQVLIDWKQGFATEFVANDGTSATSSFNSFMNDYLFYYEKFLRAGKVGIPAGVFSGTPLATHVESPFDSNKDRLYLKEAINAFESFYRGNYNGENVGPSIKDYLDYLADLRVEVSLSNEIDKKLDQISQKCITINDDFSDQITQDNIMFLELYDELQALVVLIKVDVFSALNVKVDFVDADGD